MRCFINLDIDECEISPCDGGCKNSVGSFSCTCEEGYEIEEVYHCIGK